MLEIQQEFAEAASSKTDKVAHHGYHRFYPWFLSAFRHRRIRLLEIGLDKLGSVELWLRYFSGGLELHGIDKDEKRHEDRAVTFHEVDQSSASELARFARSVGKTFDVILDDGSHVPDHQILTLGILWPLLEPGGLYILEDVETSYWGRSEMYGYDFDARVASRNLVLELRHGIDAVNSEFLPPDAKRTLQAHRLWPVFSEIEMISFGQNCIILVKKNPASFGHYYSRPYNRGTQYNKRLLGRRIGERIRSDGLASGLSYMVKKLLNR